MPSFQSILDQMRRTRVLSGLFWLTFVSAALAQAPLTPPAYVARGHQTEGRQRALKDRLGRVHDRLSDMLRVHAADLLAKLEPPPPIVYGYRILPRVVPDGPPRPLRKPEAISYSWAWSDTLISRENDALARLETDSERVESSSAGHAAYEGLVADYVQAVNRHRLIDADIDYNWLWQRQIEANRPLFDRLTIALNGAVKRVTSDSPPGTDDVPFIGFDPPEFVQIVHRADHEWLVIVPCYTDIENPELVQAFKAGVESLWHVRSQQDEFRLRLDVEIVPPGRLYCGRIDARNAPDGCSPPASGEHLDLAAHVGRFPIEGAVLTTGAASLQLVSRRAIVLGPHDVTQRTLAHELGHVLGFPDAYLRGYKDLGADGFQVMELVADSFDIMSSPGAGSVLRRHYQGLIVAKEISIEMQAGLRALHEQNDPVQAIARFRAVLLRNPDHYGGTLQLAKALDRTGQADEALPIWKRMLAMAEALPDTETAAIARARLAKDAAAR